MITFDNSPTVYWLVCYALAASVIFAADFKKIPTNIFVFISILLLVAMRLPVILFNRELNPDESQMLSHAITLFQDPVYWRSVDGTTIGPLDNYLLVIPRLLGFQINYTSGRLMGLLCSAGSLLFLFSALKNWVGTDVARRVLILPVIFLSFTQEIDFVHYSSEQLPVFLLALVLWLLSKMTENRGSLATNAYLLGLFAGIIPFSKLQAVPQAMILVLSAFWVCYRNFRLTKSYKPSLTLITGGLTFPLITLIWTYSFHVLTDLIDFYLLGNAIYAGGKGFLSIPSQFARIFSQSPDFIAFTTALSVPMLAALSRFSGFSVKKAEVYQVPITIVLLLLSSIYAVTKSGNDFIHYLNFCIIPWTLLAALGLSRLERQAIIFPILLLTWFGVYDAYYFVKERRLNGYISVNARELWQSPVVSELKRYTQKEDYMVVWGWQCVYYVEAQLAQGTAENHSERSIFNHPLREKYRSRYLADMERNKPAVVLDAVGKNSFWVQDPKIQGIESYPRLFQFIKTHYTFLGNFDGTTLYVRNDRL
jgi:hypothetical protein